MSENSPSVTDARMKMVLERHERPQGRLLPWVEGIAYVQAALGGMMVVMMRISRRDVVLIQ